MKTFFTLISFILFSSITFAAPDIAKKVQELQQMFSDVPLPDRLEKRIVYALLIISDQNNTPYSSELAPVLYSMNLKEDPTHGETYFRFMKRVLWSGYISGDRYTPHALVKAEAVMKAGQEKAPDNVWIRMGRISLAATKKEDLEVYRPQLSSLRQSVQSMGFRAQMMLADIYEDFKDHSSYSEMLRMAESNAVSQQEKLNVLTNKAYYGLRTKNYKDCVENYHALMPYGELSYANKINLLACYNGADKLDEAIALGEKMGPGGLVDCHLAKANWSRGRQHLSKGNYQDAERDLMNATKSCKKWGLYQDLAVLNDKMGNKEKAQQYNAEAERLRSEMKNKNP